MDRHTQMLGLATLPAADCADAPDFSARPGAGVANDTTDATALSAQERLARIVRTIEADIIPRLVHAHRPSLVSATLPVTPPAPAAQATADEVRAFVQCMLSGSDDDWLAQQQDLLARGVSVENIYLGLLGPAARELGEMWNQDRIPFTDVTVAVGRIQRTMRGLSPAFGSDVDHPADGRRILLLPAPGEQHTFGLAMVAEFFRRAGWDVVGDEAARTGDPATLVRSEWFDMVGISAGSDARLDWLKAGIGAVRNASRNRAIGVIVGGPAFSANPAMAQKVGADGTAVDGQQAPGIAERLLQTRLHRV